MAVSCSILANIDIDIYLYCCNLNITFADNISAKYFETRCITYLSYRDLTNGTFSG